MNALLLILGNLYAQRVQCERRRRGDRGCELCLHVKPLAKRRDWSSRRTLRVVFYIDVRDIENSEAPGTHSGIEILAARLHIEHLVTAMLIRLLEKPAAGDEFSVVIWVREL